MNSQPLPPVTAAGNSAFSALRSQSRGFNASPILFRPAIRRRKQPILRCIDLVVVQSVVNSPQSSPLDQKRSARRGRRLRRSATAQRLESRTVEIPGRRCPSRRLPATDRRTRPRAEQTVGTTKVEARRFAGSTESAAVRLFPCPDDDSAQSTIGMDCTVPPAPQPPPLTVRCVATRRRRIAAFPRTARQQWKRGPLKPCSALARTRPVYDLIVMPAPGPTPMSFQRSQSEAA